MSDPRVGPDWIAEHLDDPAVRIVEVDVGPAAYDAGHIPGAVLWNAYGHIRRPDYTLADDDELTDLLERSGIANDTTVVFYGYAAAEPRPSRRPLHGRPARRVAGGLERRGPRARARVIQTAFAGAGVTPDRRVITYCTIGNRAAQAWFALTELLGHPDAAVYYGSWAEWGMGAGGFEPP